MNAWNLTVAGSHRPGSLGKVTQVFAKEGINLEGFSAWQCQGEAYFNLLVADRERSERAATLLGQDGYKILDHNEVVVHEIEDRPGMLAEYARRCGEANINLEIAYLATGTQVVFGAKDMITLRRVLEQTPSLSAR